MSEIHESPPRTPAGLLPTELVLIAVSLTSPATSIASTCQLFASALGYRHRSTQRGPKCNSTGSNLPVTTNAWIGCIVKGSADGLTCGHDYGEDCPTIDIRFCCFFTTLRPAVYWYPIPRSQRRYAAPPLSWKVILCESLVSRKVFADWLVQRCKRLTAAKVARVDFVEHRLSQPNQDMSDDDDLPALEIVDVIFLAVFYMRSSNVDMLSYTLKSLTHLFPSLIHFETGLYTWVTFILNFDSSPVFDELERHAMNFGNPTTSFPHFLLMMACYQWSAPLASAVCAALDVDPAPFTQLAVTRDCFFEAMLSFLRQLPAYVSPVPMYRWLCKHGLEPDLEYYASIALRARTVTHFLDLFFEHDVKHLGVIMERHGREYRTLCEMFDKFGLTEVGEEHGFVVDRGSDSESESESDRDMEEEDVSDSESDWE